MTLQRLIYTLRFVQITDRKDLKRVRMKVDVYVHVVKGRRGPIRYY